MKAIKVGSVGYQFLPKVACTSIKHSLYTATEGKKFTREENEGKSVHRYFKERLQDISGCEFRFVILRDPIKRFLSAYSNRVCFHKELSQDFIKHRFPDMEKDIPIFSPGLGQFIDHFDTYKKVGPIHHHCKPTSDWLTDLSYFTHVYSFEQIKDAQTDLSNHMNTVVEFPRLQTGGRKIKLADLSQAQLDFLFDYYAKDYELLSDYYSIDDVLKAWRKGWV